VYAADRARYCDILQRVMARLNHSFMPPKTGLVRLGKSPQRLQDNRQTDVRMGWFDQQEQLLACILIESKVTADFQQGQAQSYAAELAQCRDVLGPKAACAVLVAPAAKFSALIAREVFDDCVSIEEIIDFLQVRIEKETLFFLGQHADGKASAAAFLEFKGHGIVHQPVGVC
jgi:hypothetical protein